MILFSKQPEPEPVDEGKPAEIRGGDSPSDFIDEDTEEDFGPACHHPARGYKGHVLRADALDDNEDAWE